VRIFGVVIAVRVIVTMRVFCVRMVVAVGVVLIGVVVAVGLLTCVVATMRCRCLRSFGTVLEEPGELEACADLLLAAVVGELARGGEGIFRHHRRDIFRNLSGVGVAAGTGGIMNPTGERHRNH
jgi:hypothetical protein